MLFVGKECFDMQHSHEAMTYQDEVIDEHEPAEKNTLHNGCPFSFSSSRLQHHFQNFNRQELLKSSMIFDNIFIQRNKMLWQSGLFVLIFSRQQKI